MNNVYVLGGALSDFARGRASQIGETLVVEEL
jgi:hypothetical protein